MALLSALYRPLTKILTIMSVACQTPIQNTTRLLTFGPDSGRPLCRGKYYAVVSHEASTNSGGVMTGENSSTISSSSQVSHSQDSFFFLNLLEGEMLDVSGTVCLRWTCQAGYNRERKEANIVIREQLHFEDTLAQKKRSITL